MSASALDEIDHRSSIRTNLAKRAVPDRRSLIRSEELMINGTSSSYIIKSAIVPVGRRHLCFSFLRGPRYIHDMGQVSSAALTDSSLAWWDRLSGPGQSSQPKHAERNPDDRPLYCCHGASCCVCAGVSSAECRTDDRTHIGIFPVFAAIWSRWKVISGAEPDFVVCHQKLS